MGLSFPVYVIYDELVEDTDENRILRAAIKSLLRMKDLNTPTKTKLKQYDNILSGAAVKVYNKANIPKIKYNHLNEHYKPSIDLARFILLHSSFSLSSGDTPIAHFLIYMPRLFEDFVINSLRKCDSLKSLNPSRDSFPQGKSLFFDKGKKNKKYKN